MHDHHEYSKPFRTYQRMTADPLNIMSNVLSKLQAHEGAAIQVMIRPVKDGWQKKDEP